MTAFFVLIEVWVSEKIVKQKVIFPKKICSKFFREIKKPQLFTLGASSSNEITKPLAASASSLSASVFMAAKVSASSSVRPTPEFDLKDGGPEEPPPPGPPPASDPRRACLNAEDSVGLAGLVGEGEVSF